MVPVQAGTMSLCPPGGTQGRPRRPAPVSDPYATAAAGVVPIALMRGFGPLAAPGQSALFMT